MKILRKMDIQAIQSH